MTMAHSLCGPVSSLSLHIPNPTFKLQKRLILLSSLSIFLSFTSMDQFRTRNGFNLEDDDLTGDAPVAGDDRRKRPVSGNSGKRAGTGGAAPPSCQADSCPAVLTEAKRYHRRHKVCEFHAKAAVVTVAGIRQRFCQQCSRFHELSEFDEAKRSCRRRLAGHNERRRKGPLSDGPGEGSSGGIRVGSSSGLGSPQCRSVTDEKNRAGMNLPSTGNSSATSAYKHFQIG